MDIDTCLKIVDYYALIKPINYIEPTEEEKVYLNKLLTEIKENCTWNLIKS